MGRPAPFALILSLLPALVGCGGGGAYLNLLSDGYPHP